MNTISNLRLNKSHKMRFALFSIFVCCLACRKNMVEEKPDNLVNDVKTEIIDSTTISESSDADTADEIDFDKSKWMIKDDHHYPYRDQMLPGLLSSHKLDSLTRDELIDLLG